jgi:hemolysin III
MAKKTEPAKQAKHDKALKFAARYTIGEEIFNSVTHGVGAILALIGGGVLVTLAAVYGGGLEVAACVIYSATLVVLYSMSTLYHAFPFPRLKRVFRVFDHSSIFLLIAGTYTPFMLITLQGKGKGLVIFILVWVCAFIGITLNAISVNHFAKLSLVLYLIMGWSIIFAIGDVVAALGNGVWLLLAGGVSYTAGVAFYLAKRIKYMHSVWHLFVLAGSVLHYLCITIYVLPR